MNQVNRVIEILKVPTGTFMVNTADVIGMNLKHEEQWEPWLARFYNGLVQQDWVCIDAGANIGTHTIQLAKLCDRVYAFEPQVMIYNMLCCNISLNNNDFQINAIKKGLGDKEEVKQLWNIAFEHFGQGLFNWGGRGIEQEGCGKPYDKDDVREYDQIEVTTLDSYNLDRCDLIKIDIQGYESKAFAGGDKTIDKFKPFVLLENSNLESPELDNNMKAKQWLLDKGYEFYRLMMPENKKYMNDDCFALHPENKYYSLAKNMIDGAPEGWTYTQEL